MTTTQAVGRQVGGHGTRGTTLPHPETLLRNSCPLPAGRVNAAITRMLDGARLSSRLWQEDVHKSAPVYYPGPRRSLGNINHCWGTGGVGLGEETGPRDRLLQRYAQRSVEGATTGRNVLSMRRKSEVASRRLQDYLVDEVADSLRRELGLLPTDISQEVEKEPAVGKEINKLHTGPSERRLRQRRSVGGRTGLTNRLSASLSDLSTTKCDVTVYGSVNNVTDDISQPSCGKDTVSEACMNHGISSEDCTVTLNGSGPQSSGGCSSVTDNNHNQHPQTPVPPLLLTAQTTNQPETPIVINRHSGGSGTPQTTNYRSEPLENASSGPSNVGPRRTRSWKNANAARQSIARHKTVAPEDCHSEPSAMSRPFVTSPPISPMAFRGTPSGVHTLSRTAEMIRDKRVPPMPSGPPPPPPKVRFSHDEPNESEKDRLDDSGVGVEEEGGREVQQVNGVDHEVVPEGIKKKHLPLLQNKRVFEKELACRLERRMEIEDQLLGDLSLCMEKETMREKVESTVNAVKDVIRTNIFRDRNGDRIYSVLIDLGKFHRHMCHVVDGYIVNIQGTTFGEPEHALTKEISIEFPESVIMANLSVRQIGPTVEMEVPFKKSELMTDLENLVNKLDLEKEETHSSKKSDSLKIDLQSEQNDLKENPPELPVSPPPPSPLIKEPKPMRRRRKSNRGSGGGSMFMMTGNNSHLSANSVNGIRRDDHGVNDSHLSANSVNGIRKDDHGENGTNAVPNKDKLTEITRNNSLFSGQVTRSTDQGTENSDIATLNHGPTTSSNCHLSDKSGHLTTNDNCATAIYDCLTLNSGPLTDDSNNVTEKEKINANVPGNSDHMTGVVNHRKRNRGFTKMRHSDVGEAANHVRGNRNVPSNSDNVTGGSNHVTNESSHVTLNNDHVTGSAGRRRDNFYTPQDNQGVNLSDLDTQRQGVSQLDGENLLTEKNLLRHDKENYWTSVKDPQNERTFRSSHIESTTSVDSLYSSEDLDLTDENAESNKSISELFVPGICGHNEDEASKVQMKTNLETVKLVPLNKSDTPCLRESRPVQDSSISLQKCVNSISIKSENREKADKSRQLRTQQKGNPRSTEFFFHKETPIPQPPAAESFNVDLHGDSDRILRTDETSGYKNPCWLPKSENNKGRSKFTVNSHVKSQSKVQKCQPNASDSLKSEASFDLERPPIKSVEKVINSTKVSKDTVSNTEKEEEVEKEKAYFSGVKNIKEDKGERVVFEEEKPCMSDRHGDVAADSQALFASQKQKILTLSRPTDQVEPMTVGSPSGHATYVTTNRSSVKGDSIQVSESTRETYLINTDQEKEIEKDKTIQPSLEGEVRKLCAVTITESEREVTVEDVIDRQRVQSLEKPNSDIEEQILKKEESVSYIRELSPSRDQPTSKLEKSNFYKKRPISGREKSISGRKQAVSYMKQSKPISNIEESISHKKLTSDIKHPISNEDQSTTSSVMSRLSKSITTSNIENTGEPVSNIKAVKSVGKQTDTYKSLDEEKVARMQKPLKIKMQSSRTRHDFAVIGHGEGQEPWIDVSISNDQCSDGTDTLVESSDPKQKDLKEETNTPIEDDLKFDGVQSKITQEESSSTSWGDDGSDTKSIILCGLGKQAESKVMCTENNSKKLRGQTTVRQVNSSLHHCVDYNIESNADTLLQPAKQPDSELVMDLQVKVSEENVHSNDDCKYAVEEQKELSVSANNKAGTVMQVYERPKRSDERGKSQHFTDSDLSFLAKRRRARAAIRKEFFPIKMDSTARLTGSSHNKSDLSTQSETSHLNENVKGSKVDISGKDDSSESETLEIIQEQKGKDALNQEELPNRLCSRVQVSKCVRPSNEGISKETEKEEYSSKDSDKLKGVPEISLKDKYSNLSAKRGNPIESRHDSVQESENSVIMKDISPKNKYPAQTLPHYYGEKDRVGKLRSLFENLGKGESTHMARAKTQSSSTKPAIIRTETETKKKPNQSFTSNLQLKL